MPLDVVYDYGEGHNVLVYGAPNIDWRMIWDDVDARVAKQAEQHLRTGFCFCDRGGYLPMCSNYKMAIH